MKKYTYEEYAIHRDEIEKVSWPNEYWGDEYKTKKAETNWDKYFDKLWKDNPKLEEDFCERWLIEHNHWGKKLFYRTH